MHEDKLYAIAMQCARFNDQGCSCDCHHCQFNVFNYVNDVREASLLKANAYTDYHNQKQILDEARRTTRAYELAPLVFLILLIGGLAWCCSTVQSCFSPQYAYVNPQQAAPDMLQLGMTGKGRHEQLKIDEEVRYLLNNPNRIENVPRVLAVMRQQGVRDVNGDGLINCIDHSITFRNLYGSNAKIIINHNRRNGMNHMFVRVYYDSGSKYIDIEPQGTPERYSMGLIWGVQYDWFYNRDVTNQWGQYVGGM